MAQCLFVDFDAESWRIWHYELAIGVGPGSRSHEGCPIGEASLILLQMLVPTSCRKVQSRRLKWTQSVAHVWCRRHAGGVGLLQLPQAVTESRTANIWLKNVQRSR